MELRKCEEQVNELSKLYESLRVASKIKEGLLPQLKGVNGEALEISEQNSVDTSNESSTPSSLAKVVEILHQVQNILHDLEPKVEKFQKRLAEKDPVTGNPRYGEKTQQRITHLLHFYNFVRKHIPESTEEGAELNTSTIENPLYQLEKQYKEEQQKQKMQIEMEEKQTLQEKINKEEEEKRRKLEEEQLQKLQKEEEERVEREERERLHQQAEQVRQARVRQQQEEKEWFESIQKGAEGVKRYLEQLKQTIDDKAVHAKAVESLYRIFQQINAHPEETKFRRIRRDHEQFVQDVGRHSGGIELLIAAGFQLGAIDDVPCYLSKEPDIEKDMDGWSKWFDVNKATLEILEEAVQQLE